MVSATGLAVLATATPREPSGLLESVWPFLTNTGDRSESDRLKARLDRHLEAKKLYLQGEVDQAIAMLPECEKMQRIKHNIESGARYRRTLEETYGH